MANSNVDYKKELLDKQSSKTGLRGKINANCIDCVYDPIEAGSWRKQVENCHGFSCFLYSVRPTPLKNTK
ncbi:hypothetical protein GPUN_0874 [Glaciecola punicea ACAM 611]|uniref:Uncharacterized protein n=1 Tax=Glaciecola punicea ACAM 611 TaxID=1121923 RepID=H5T9M9_9ALTE|nr:hypothetical protein [Glaciecola punicea]GAB55006.1 hypothetical protein GPUN_0874 [Glaciecola punicea ACAM 611]